ARVEDKTVAAVLARGGEDDRRGVGVEQQDGGAQGAGERVRPRAARGAGDQREELLDGLLGCRHGAPSSPPPGGTGGSPRLSAGEPAGLNPGAGARFAVPNSAQGDQSQALA